MTRRSHPTRRTAVAIVVLGSLTIAACGDDDAADEGAEQADDGDGLFGDGDEESSNGTSSGETSDDVDSSPDDGVQLLASGATDSVKLPVAYEVGQQATSEMQMSLAISTDMTGASADAAIGLSMQMSQEVTTASTDEVTLEMTIDTIEVTDAPAGAEQQLVAEFEPLIGEVLVVRYDANGKQIGDTVLKSGEQMPAQFAESFESTTSQVLFPTEEVGVGAEWTAVVPMESNGMELDIETTYTLTELTADEYVITMRQDTEVDSDVQGTSVAGTMAGTGEVRGSRTNPLLQHMTYDQDAELSLGGAGDMSITIGIDLSSK